MKVPGGAESEVHQQPKLRIRVCFMSKARRTTRSTQGVSSAASDVYTRQFQNYAGQTGIGLSRSVSAGNAAATGIADYLEWFADDPETDVGLCYVEGLTDGRDFFERMATVTRRMPVVVVKGGATSGGQRAAASHTGSLASDDRVFDGMARQAGMARTHTNEAAFDAAALNPIHIER